MQAATQSTLDRDSFSVNVSGRVFPRSVRNRLPETAPRIAATERLPEQRSTESVEPKMPRPNPLREAIVGQLWRLLPLAAIPANQFREAEQIVEAYVSSYQRLQAAHEEANGLIKTLCQAQVSRQFNPKLDGLDTPDLVQQKVGELTAISLPVVLPSKVLNASLLNRTRAEIYGQLYAELRTATEKFVGDFVDALEQLVDRDVVGLVEWQSRTACRFHFFRRVLQTTLDSDKTQTRTQSRRDGGTRTTRKRTKKGRHIHQLIRHEQQLMRAEALDLDQTRVSVPPVVRPVLEGAPEWLAPLMRIVAGDCFRERTIRQTQREESWQDTHVAIEDLPAPVIEDHPVYYFDPAVTVGEFVLAGWNDAEVQATIEPVEVWPVVSEAGGWLLGAAVVLLIGMLWLPLLRWVGLVVALGSLWPLNRAIQDFSALQGWRGVSRDLLLRINSAGVAGIFATISLVLALVHWSFLLTLVAVTLIGLGAALLLVRNRGP